MNLTNFYDHPSDGRYLIFRFYDEEYISYFESLLKEDEVPYEIERDVNEENNEVCYFGVNKRYSDQAIKANYLTYAKYRRPMINSPFLRYALVIGVILLVILAIIGALVRDL